MAFELTIIMYHYVRDPARTPFPKIHAVLPAEFRTHLDRLAARYSFIGMRDVMAALRGELQLPKRSCLLTFDDGLKDHASNVFPLLRERGIPGLFFLITAGQEEERVIDVHKIHFLIANLGTVEMIEAFGRFVALHCPDRNDELRIDEHERKSNSRYDDILTGNLKATLNRLDQSTRAAFLGDLFPKTFGDERTFARNLYLSWDDANRMIAGGMDIGSHTHTHRHLTNLTAGEQEYEIVRARDLLAVRTRGRAVPALSYPYGPWNNGILEIARTAGYTLGFTVETGTNTSLEQPLLLKRVNANDVLSL